MKFDNPHDFIQAFADSFAMVRIEGQKNAYASWVPRHPENERGTVVLYALDKYGHQGNAMGPAIEEVDFLPPPPYCMYTDHEQPVVYLPKRRLRVQYKVGIPKRLHCTMILGPEPQHDMALSLQTIGAVAYAMLNPDDNTHLSFVRAMEVLQGQGRGAISIAPDLAIAQDRDWLPGVCLMWNDTLVGQVKGDGVHLPKEFAYLAPKILDYIGEVNVK